MEAAVREDVPAPKAVADVTVIADSKREDHEVSESGAGSVLGSRANVLWTAHVSARVPLPPWNAGGQ